MRRILFVSHYALPHLGGIEVAIDALGRELAGRGHEVVHVASAAESADAPEPLPYRVVRVPALNTLERSLHVPYPLFSPGLVRALRREIGQADVVHAHGLLYMGTVTALALAKRDGRPIRAATEHVGHVPYESALLDRGQAMALGTLGRWSARAAEAVVVLNDKVEEEVAALAPGTPIRTIHNGVDTERYRPAEPGERAALRERLGWDAAPHVLFVGRLVGKKGVHAALEAARAADKSFRLVVAGPGEVEDVPDNAELLGPQPPERVPELYRAADAFLLPSRGEGFPITAQEAMASGLPVVLGDDPAYRPYIEGAGAGVRLVPPDGEAIASALRELLADEDTRAAAGRAAARHAREAFSWPAAADAHEALWDELRRKRS